MMDTTLLSKNFSLGEFTRSDVAQRSGIDNTHATLAQVLNLAHLCHMVLQPLRDKFGPIRINSGLRCPELNKLVGGTPNSQHLLGEAADIYLPTKETGIRYMKFLMTLPTVDQLIWEKNAAGICWIHVSSKRLGKNRRHQLLTEPININNI